MKKTLWALMMALIMVWGTPLSVQSQTDAIAEIDSYLEMRAEEDIFSGSVLIAQDGQILLSDGYGMADREWRVPNSADTKFQISGLTEQFTAMSILLLQEKGLLKTNDLICAYLDECPDIWQDITVYNLLTHSSGIPDYINDINLLPMLGQRIRNQDLINMFIDDALEFAPGDEVLYSASDYVLLAQIVNSVAGSSYNRFVEQNLLRPLGLENTGFVDNEEILEKRAEGYILTGVLSNKKLSTAHLVHPSWLHGCCDMYSTVEDLYVWIQALQNGEVVQQETWETMWESAFQLQDTFVYVLPQVVPVQTAAQGYGAMNGIMHGHRVVLQEGKSPGYMSQIVHFTDDHVTLIVLDNLYEDNTGIFWRVIQETIDKLYPEE